MTFIIKMMQLSPPSIRADKTEPEPLCSVCLFETEPTTATTKPTHSDFEKLNLTHHISLAWYF